MLQKKITEKKDYTDFYFFACLDELLAKADSIWKSSLDGTEIEDIANYLKIAIDKKHIIDTYWDESKHTIEIYHSSGNELEFLYFDLRRMITDQNDMFFFGVRCEKRKKDKVMEKLISIYDLLETSGSFSYEKWGWKLLNLQNKYLVLKGDYVKEGEIIHHK